jgi:hypothetical protein
MSGRTELSGQGLAYVPDTQNTDLHVFSLCFG